jgi:hypothetical protein
MFNHGYIFESGFMKSYQLNEVVFNDGRPAPWFNYPFTDFLSNRLNETLSIFEYGLGNSTKYFNTFSTNCFGVDHDAKWYNKVVNTIDKKSNYSIAENEDYINAIEKAQIKFDIIVVDGILRDHCIKSSIQFLSTAGVIILDDSERVELNNSISYLNELGFKELRISGLKPLGRHYSCTSVFYRDGNCLEI